METAQDVWLPVIGRALAYLCMKTGASADDEMKTLAGQARFLEALGLKRADVAEMLDSTPGSIAELLRLARNKKGKKRGRK